MSFSFTPFEVRRVHHFLSFNSYTIHEYSGCFTFASILNPIISTRSCITHSRFNLTQRPKGLPGAAVFIECIGIGFRKRNTESRGIVEGPLPFTNLPIQLNFTLKYLRSSIVHNLWPKLSPRLKAEYEQFLRWAATIISRPDVSPSRSQIDETTLFSKLDRRRPPVKADFATYLRSTLPLPVDSLCNRLTPNRLRD